MNLDTLKDRCLCLSNIKNEELETLFNSFIRFLSNITCWDIEGGTILPECRTHTVKLTKPFCTYTCIDVRPYWKNIDLNTVSLEVRQYTARGMNVIPIGTDYFNYDDISDKFYVELDGLLEDADESCDKNCINNVLVFRYTAGYDLESPEWLDLICHYLTAYVALANDCASVDECSSKQQIAIGAKLVRKTVDTLNYEWEVDENSKEVFFSRLMQNFYIDLLGRYALCGREYSLREKIYIGKGN